MINYLNPDYTDVFIERQIKLANIRSNPQLLQAMKIHYRYNPWDFITDWGFTFDPRQIEKGKLATIPFILWERQVEFLHWLMERWQASEYGLVEKSRDCGVTWLCVGFTVACWLFVPGFSAGFGSAKEAKVDKKGDPDCIFEKIRFFLKYVPIEFYPNGYVERVHSGFMKLVNPETEATITGDAGDEIGRGGRKSMWIVDEAAFVDHQQMVANAISASTNFHLDVSTYNGNGNLFYKKAMKFDKTNHKFIFDWRDDPRKDDEWYAKQKREKDSVTVAQEIDRDPNASAEDVFIPSKWVNAAIDLHKLIKVPPTGLKVTAFDPADVGDARAVVCKHGYVITAAELLHDGDITQAIPWAYEQAYNHQADALVYDADGMGAPTMKMSFENCAAGRMQTIPFYGSGSIVDKEKRYGEDPAHPDKTLKKNKDKFLNYRAQTATWLRDLFEESYNVRQQIEAGGVAVGVDVSKIISIDSSCTALFELVAELSRPRRQWTTNGKIKVESKKDMKSRQIESPNLFDGGIMATSVRKLVPLSGTKKRVQTRTIRARDPGLGL